MKLYANMLLGMVTIIEKGKRIKQKSKTGYPVIGGGVKYNGYSENYNYEDEITISFKGSPGIVQHRNYKFFASEACLVIKPTFMLDKRYLYHMLKSKEAHFRQMCSKLIPELDIDAFKKYEIPVPSLDVQQIVSRKLDYFLYITEQFENETKKEIENITKLKNEFSKKIFGGLND